MACTRVLYRFARQSGNMDARSVSNGSTGKDIIHGSFSI